MVKIKSSQEIDKNYRDATGLVAVRYKSAVLGTSDWAERAKSDNAESLYAAGVQRAAEEKSRQVALEGVSNQQWQAAAAGTGAARIAGGMLANADKRTRHFEPIRQAIGSATLSDRTSDPLANVKRVSEMVQVIVEASRKKR